ncbi:unnamed protein product, partial [Owenia fusiformis]
MMIENLTEVTENSGIGVENNMSAPATIKCGTSQLECDVKTEYCNELYNNCSSCIELCPLSGISQRKELCQRLCPVWLKEAGDGNESPGPLEEGLSNGAITAIICVGLVIIFCTTLITWAMYIDKLDKKRQKELELKCKKLKYVRLCIEPDENKLKSTKVQIDNKVSPSDNQKKHSSERQHIRPIDSKYPLLD